jgi:hypothetical protein
MVPKLLVARCPGLAKVLRENLDTLTKPLAKISTRSPSCCMMRVYTQEQNLDCHIVDISVPPPFRPYACDWYSSGYANDDHTMKPMTRVTMVMQRIFTRYRMQAQTMKSRIVRRQITDVLPTKRNHVSSESLRVGAACCVKQTIFAF